MHILLLDEQSPSLLSPLRESFQNDSQPVMIDNVCTAETALQRLRSRSYDWLMTDLEATDGIDLVNTAVNEKLIASKRIFVVTSLPENTILIQAIREQGIHIRQKPVSVKQIREAIQLQ